MPTLSTNIAGTVRPFGAEPLRRVFPYGEVPISGLKKKRKKKKDDPITYLGEVAVELEERWNKKVGDDKWKVGGKLGKWRRAQRHNVFFPDDGSAPIGMPEGNRGKGLKGADKKAAEKASSELSGKKKMIAASMRKTLAKIQELKKKGKKELSKAQLKALGQEGTIKAMLRALESGDSKKFKKLQSKLGKKIA